MSDCNTVVEKSLYQAVANPEAIQEVITVSFTALVLLEKMDLDFWNRNSIYYGLVSIQPNICLQKWEQIMFRNKQIPIFFSVQTPASFLVGKRAREDLISSPNVIEISIRREEATFALLLIQSSLIKLLLLLETDAKKVHFLTK